MQITAFKAILAQRINVKGCEDYKNTFAQMESDCMLRFGFKALIESILKCFLVSSRQVPPTNRLSLLSHFKNDEGSCDNFLMDLSVTWRLSTLCKLC